MVSSASEKIKSHGVFLMIFIIVVIGIIIWKLTQPSWQTGEGFLDAGLAEIRAQVLASAYKHKSPADCKTGLCPLSDMGNGISGSAPCFLGIKDQSPGQKPLPELAPVAPKQFPKCLRCEDVINRAISITPANGAFALGHFLAKKKDNNSIVIIPEVIENSAVRRATDGNFRLILGLADPLKGVSIYHPETDRVIARSADGQVALSPINDFTGSLAPAATFELVDGPMNYSAVAIKCLPIGGELPTQPKYLGFAPQTTPGGNPIMVLAKNQEFPKGATYEFDIVDIETGIPVIMNKHSGLACQKPVEGFWDGIASNTDTDSNFETRDKRKIKGLVQEGELGQLEIRKEETNGVWSESNSQNPKQIKGIQQELTGIKPVNLEQLMVGLPPMSNNIKELAIELSASELAGMDRPFATLESFADSNQENPAVNSVGMLPITIEELGRIPDNPFKPAAGLAFNNVLNIQNQVYKEQLADKVFQKLNAAKLSPSVQNILDYNTASHNIYERENRDFAEKISKQTRTNTEKLDNLISELDKQRVQSMSKDLFFLQNQFSKANARPLSKN